MIKHTKKQRAAKLNLQAETIRALRASQLDGVVGGGAYTSVTDPDGPGHHAVCCPN